LDDSRLQLAPGLVPALPASRDETDYRCTMKTMKTNKLRRAIEANSPSSIARLCLFSKPICFFSEIARSQAMEVIDGSQFQITPHA